MSVSAFCHQLESSPRGRIILSNIKFDILHNRLHHNAIRRIFSIILSELDSPSFSGDPCNLIEVACLHDPQGWISYCLDQPMVTEQVFRVVDRKEFIDINIDHLAAGITITDDTDRATVIRLCSIDLTGFTKGTMGGRKGFAWIGPKRFFDNLQLTSPPDGLADEVRNSLGLMHFPNGTWFIVVIYPRTFAAHNSIKAPTFIQGSPAIYWRSSENSDHWGRTVNLRTLRDSCPEGIHGNAPFNPLFRIVDIGKVKNPVDPSEDDFLSAHPTPWNPPDVSLIESILL